MPSNAILHNPNSQTRPGDLVKKIGREKLALHRF